MEKMNKKKVIIFTVLTLVLSNAFAVAAAMIAKGISDPLKSTSFFKTSLSVMMFIPLIMAIVVKADFRGMGIKPRLKGNAKWIVFSLLVPMLLTVLAAALFFIIFPDLFDINGSYFREYNIQMGMDVVAILESKGMSYKGYVLINVIGCLTYIPFINMFIAVGEEVGWRGFLYPELRKGFGRVKTWIIGGIIWGAFHFGAMLAGGYEYGFDYIGAPVLGLVTFCISCIALGILHEVIYDRTKSIWFPALFHGSVNAAMTTTMCCISASNPEKLAKYQVLGPYANGLISGIPVLIAAIILGAYALKKDRER